MELIEIEQVNLNTIWKRAEAMGRISVDTDWKGVYEAEIYFESRTGSKIRAIGKDVDVTRALLIAISEVKRMSE